MPGRLAELLGQLRQEVVRFKVAPCLRDLVSQHLRIREVLEQRDDVGECLMERPCIATAVR